MPESACPKSLNPRLLLPPKIITKYMEFQQIATHPTHTINYKFISLSRSHPVIQTIIDKKVKNILTLSREAFPPLSHSDSITALPQQHTAKKNTDTLVFWFLLLIGGFFSTAWRAAFMFPLQNNSQGLHNFNTHTCIYIFNQINT